MPVVDRANVLQGDRSTVEFQCDVDAVSTPGAFELDMLDA